MLVTIIDELHKYTDYGTDLPCIAKKTQYKLQFYIVGLVVANGFKFKTSKNFKVELVESNYQVV